MDPVSLLTKLIADIRARDLWDAIADCGFLLALAAPYIKSLFSAEHHAAMSTAAPSSIDDFTTHLEAHLEDAKAGAFNWPALGALLVQLAPFLLSLLLKPKPAPAA